jgi:antitoxin component of RelBE/YafQ-DinJ toxin-antitoxin module
MKKIILTLSASIFMFFSVQAQTQQVPVEQRTTKETETRTTETTVISPEVRSNNEEKLSDVPAAVRASFMSSEHSDMLIEEVEMEDNNYILKGKKANQDVELEYDSNGRLISKEKEDDGDNK